MLESYVFELSWPRLCGRSHVSERFYVARALRKGCAPAATQVKATQKTMEAVADLMRSEVTSDM